MLHISSGFLSEGPRVAIRHFTLEDGPEFTARTRESRNLHQPWLFPPDSDEAYANYVARLTGEHGKAGFLVCEKDTGGIAGFITVNNIVRGGFQCGALGYGAFFHAAGRGLMREGLDLVIEYAFGPLGLHRLEINVQPGNTASIALARGAGFRLEGFSPSMIRIDGAWRDHERWALTAEMRPLG
ncbi:N-acetyltransferase [Streptomyces pluripotens]|uniref:N-acetyltransferase n=1 Tax=Streptomyces pluripotens TaxID=1355015 RepID=A0A221P590_9ACTN|nr:MULTISPECIES: GNAT family protein [Streptomyces]ARP73169.1 GNAT family N-acetyltransferase [Streptomyces pluripotens]ASN27419.1 N-acetyltransferase [Streptomyces pluripotens]KIE28612.1 acetyltransferase [Streptomyces sp. MUSC 125]MCH0558056.1 GNAT family N-acetyltransferase [Streptomyces sp. MUM 16J]